MRHATSGTLQEIEPLLEELRSVPGLVEKKPGIFYRRSKAFLHFHEDPSGLHADVRFGEEFERVRAETAAERKALIARVRALPSSLFELLLAVLDKRSSSLVVAHEIWYPKRVAHNEHPLLLTN